MAKVYSGNLSGNDRSIGIVISRTNDFIGNHLLEGAKDNDLPVGYIDQAGVFSNPVPGPHPYGINDSV